MQRFPRGKGEPIGHKDDGLGDHSCRELQFAGVSVPVTHLRLEAMECIEQPGRPAKSDHMCSLAAS
jgi:hypothetical protein